MIIHCLECDKDVAKVEFRDGVIMYRGLMGLLSARLRFDGNWGFQCSCGNDSRLAQTEKGLITSLPPSQKILKQVESNIKKSPTKVMTNKEGITCDGFIIKKSYSLAI